MMNMNDEDVNLEDLALGSKENNIRTRLNSNSSGAGVNADTRIEFSFATSDPLSELVWSPRSGLRLKCAKSNAADKKPFLLWNVGPSCNGLAPSQIIRPDDSRDDQINLTVSQTMLNADDVFIHKATLKPSENCPDSESNRMMVEEAGTKASVREEEAGTKAAVREEENCSNDREEDSCCPQKKSKVETNASSGNITGLYVANCVEPHETELPEALQVTSATETTNINKMNMPNSIPAPPLGKPEFSAENDLGHPTGKDALYRQKGKEKALSEGDIYIRSLDDEDDSHESVESCNSAGLFSKGLKRQRYDKGVILGSKSMKKQIHGSPGSTSIIRPDSSFLSWISNMMKGLSDCNKEDYPKTQDFASMNMGFQTVFQSSYSRDTNVLSTGVQKENDSIEESGELVVSDKASLRNLNSCKQVSPVIVGQPSKLCADIDCSQDPYGSNLADNKVSNRADSFGEQINITAEKTTLDIPMAISAVPEGHNPVTSLWITRFSSKIPRSEKCDGITEKPVECYTCCQNIDLDSWVKDVFLKSSEAKDNLAVKKIEKIATNNEESVDLKSKNKLCPVWPSQKYGSPEAMASVFARRLDALRCYQTWNLHMSSIKRVSTSDEMRINTPSTLVNDVKDNLKSPPHDTITAQSTVAQMEIFHAIRNLRLSRADILRWMNSNVSLSHLNGFFLRLRLGKLEAGLGNTSYTVACITGGGVEDNGCVLKKSILVNVGGIKSSIASQYVSNHDFLEDEIMAWWCSIVDSGCSIPSVDELNSMFDYRKSLGF